MSEIFGEWISIKKKMPTAIEVLVCMQNKFIRIGYLHNSKLNVMCSYCSEENPITHWMPLPSPSKDENDES